MTALLCVAAVLYIGALTAGCCMSRHKHADVALVALVAASGFLIGVVLAAAITTP